MTYWKTFILFIYMYVNMWEFPVVLPNHLFFHLMWVCFQ